MANLVNLPEVLTFNVLRKVFLKKPGQALVRGGPEPMPFLGLRKHRTQSGQVWPRPETPQRDKLGVV